MKVKRFIYLLLSVLIVSVFYLDYNPVNAASVRMKSSIVLEET